MLESKWCYNLQFIYTLQGKRTTGYLSIIAVNYNQAESKLMAWSNNHGYDVTDIKLNSDFACWE